MLKYAASPPVFFKAYVAGLAKLGALGWTRLQSLSL